MLKKCPIPFENSLDERKIDDFEKLTTLGMGSFAKVYKVRHKRSNNFYALKEINKKQLMDQIVIEYVEREIEIMLKINHKNIIKLYYYFEDDDFFYLILELAEKGQLYRKLFGNEKLDE